MIHILLGPDDYSKSHYISSLSKQRGGSLRVFGNEDVLPPVSMLAETDLFSKPGIFVFEGVMPEINDRLDSIIKSPNLIIISLISLDKRKKENKHLLTNTEITVREFLLPHAKDLDKWIIERTKTLGGQISPAAAGELAMRLGRDQAKETKVGGKLIAAEEVYSLWQADSEIKKLIAFAAGKEIAKEDVVELVSENLEVDAFQITNAIADKRKSEAFSLINKVLKDQNPSDEKGGVIQLNALLSEQFRNVAMVQDFLNRKIGDEEILRQTAWKSGRLYIMKKIAERFQPKKVLETLTKLGAMDEELKTSQTPPRMLLDLILAQII